MTDTVLVEIEWVREVTGTTFTRIDPVEVLDGEL